MVGQRLERLDVDEHVGEAVLDALVLADGVVELNAVLGVLGGQSEYSLRGTDSLKRNRHRATVGQEGEVVGGDRKRRPRRDTVEGRRSKRLGPVDAGLRRQRRVPCIHDDQVRFYASSGCQQKVRRCRGVADEWLGARHGLNAFKTDAFGVDPSRIVVQADAEDGVSRGDPGKPLGLHVATAGAVDGGRCQRLGDDRQRAQAAAGLLENHRQVDPLQTDSAVGFRDNQREPAEIRRLSPEFSGQAAVLSPHHVQRAGVGHETQNLLPQQVLFL